MSDDQQSIRPFLKALEESGSLLRIPKAVDPAFELAAFLSAAEAGKALQIAVAVGAHPAIQLAACLYLGVGDDEIECAGSLLDAPVRMVPARTVDLLVPADAEIVLEGEIDARQPIEEGFVSEY